MYGKRTFRMKFGDPESLEFKGQVWDSRNADATPGNNTCAICRRHVRFIFLLKQDPTKTPDATKLEVGRCCFHYFRRWNKDLFWQLYHALQYTLNVEAAIHRDKKRFAKGAA